MNNPLSSDPNSAWAKWWKTEARAAAGIRFYARPCAVSVQKLTREKNNTFGRRPPAEPAVARRSSCAPSTWTCSGCTRATSSTAPRPCRCVGGVADARSLFKAVRAPPGRRRRTAGRTRTWRCRSRDSEADTHRAQAILRNALLVWSLQNPKLSYRQGERGEEAPPTPLREFRGRTGPKRRHSVPQSPEPPLPPRMRLPLRRNGRLQQWLACCVWFPPCPSLSCLCERGIRAPPPAPGMHELASVLFLVLFKDACPQKQASDLARRLSPTLPRFAHTLGPFARHRTLPFFPFSRLTNVLPRAAAGQASGGRRLRRGRTPRRPPLP